jgi:hypothetical protein
MTEAEQGPNAGTADPNAPNLRPPGRVAILRARSRGTVGIRGLLGGATALGVVGVVLLLLGSASAAAPVGATLVLTAPYHGSAQHSQLSSIAGCANTSFPVTPKFTLSSGKGRLESEAIASAPCTARNGSTTSTATATASAWLAETILWNSSSNTTQTAAFAWNVSWTVSERTTTNATLFSDSSSASLEVFATLIDLTTNRTLAQLSVVYTTTYNVTGGAYSQHRIASPILSKNVRLVAGDRYEFETGLVGVASSSAQGSTPGRVITAINVANAGNAGYLGEVEL